MKRFKSSLVYAFDKVNHTNKSIKHTGLFGYQGLNSPKGLEDAATECVEQARALVEKVVNASTAEEIRKTVKRVDTISDILCSVLDAAELIRHVHPHQEFVEAANKTSTMLHSYLNQLNTNRGLYQSLKRVFETPTIAKDLNWQERKVAQLLLQDFEKSGVHMPLETRQKFIEMNDSILQLGQEFAMNSYPSQELVTIKNPKFELRGVPSRLVDALMSASRSSSHVNIPSYSEIASLVLRTAESEETRKRLFLAMNSGSNEQVNLLEKLLKKRGELAVLLNQKSYGHLYLTDKMASSPGMMD
jgi:intermediate peptidase